MLVMLGCFVDRKYKLMCIVSQANKSGETALPETFRVRMSTLLMFSSDTVERQTISRYKQRSLRMGGINSPM